MQSTILHYIALSTERISNTYSYVDFSGNDVINKGGIGKVNMRQYSFDESSQATRR